MVISIMELLTVLDAKFNVMHVYLLQAFVYLVMELIELLGVQKIIFVRKLFIFIIINRCYNGYFHNGVSNCVRCEK